MNQGTGQGHKLLPLGSKKKQETKHAGRTALQKQSGLSRARESTNAPRAKEGFQEASEPVGSRKPTDNKVQAKAAVLGSTSSS